MLIRRRKMAEDEDECTVPMMLREGTSHTWGGVSEIQQGKYNPLKTSGWKVGDGDVQGNTVLEVPDCPE
jgi:hypothetical protein